MGNRHLKIVWLFTLAAILMLLVVQAFLIRKEYIYQMEQQTQEVRHIIDSCKIELRSLEDSEIKANNQFADANVLKMPSKMIQSVHVERVDSLMLDSLVSFVDSINQRGNDVKLSAVNGEKSLALQFNSAFNKSNTVVLKSTRFNMQGSDVTSSELIAAAKDWSVYSKRPFDLERFRSLVMQKGYEILAADTLTTEKFLWKSQVRLKGRGLKPFIDILTPYNAVQKKSVHIQIPVKVAEALEAMWQVLLLALLLSVLLLGAMFIQVKTILRQQKINTLKTNFTGTMIHELKRPVQALQTIVSVMEGEEEEQDRTLILNAARKELDNLSMYLQKLRDVNKEEQVIAGLNLSWYNFYDSLQFVINQFQQKGNKPIEVSLKSPGQVMIVADKLALEGVLTNIFENSIKFCDKEVVCLDIDVSFNKSGLNVSIQDNGIGISPNDLNMVTQPFFRSSNPIVRTLPGIGLGLNYVRMIIEAHNGKLTISSNQLGTIVAFKLPQESK